MKKEIRTIEYTHTMNEPCASQTESNRSIKHVGHIGPWSFICVLTGQDFQVHGGGAGHTGRQNVFHFLEGRWAIILED